MELIGMALVSLLYVGVMAFLGVLIVGIGIAILTGLAQVPKYLSRLPRK